MRQFLLVVVLLAAGAGYAVARRRRSSKKLISLLLACLTDASNGEGKCLYGLIIFPDTYIHPSSDLAPLPPKINDPNSAFTDNNYTIAQWTEMEKAKAVFLPAAGCRWTNPDASIIAYKFKILIIIAIIGLLRTTYPTHRHMQRICE